MPHTKTVQRIYAGRPQKTPDRALQEKILPLWRHENPQDNEGETGIFIDMSMQPEAVLRICSSYNSYRFT
jgi:hypothetical protein